MQDGWTKDVLDFWFGECGPDDWFGGGEAFDEKVRARFGDLHRSLMKATPPQAERETEAALAAVIALDQFPRNIHRGQAEAFVLDDQALRLARNAIERGLDDALDSIRRKFLYMPFMHSERLADQERGLDLFRRLGDEETVKYAIEHRDIIQRFGRFPHRNRALGRASTSAERAFLIGHEGFGQ